MRSGRLFVISTVAVFLVIFNLGYVFHEPLLGAWFHREEAIISRDEFIVPLVALAFLVYSVILAHLFPIYRQHYPGEALIPLSLRFGIIMGVLFDALQGGLIEYATFKMPFVVFVVDSGYHVFIEGSLAGLTLATVYHRWGPKESGERP